MGEGCKLATAVKQKSPLLDASTAGIAVHSHNLQMGGGWLRRHQKDYPVNRLEALLYLMEGRLV